jgi:hypothetical protein
MVGEVVDVDEVAIGDRLRVEFNRVDDDLTMPFWRLDTSTRPSRTTRRPKEMG